MFDIGFYEVLVFAVVTLIFVGPKELPVLMRTVGRYVGILRRQADEFRSHFDAAMQEAEIDQMQAELESVSKEMDRSLDTASSGLDNTTDQAPAEQPLEIDNDEMTEGMPDGTSEGASAPKSQSGPSDRADSVGGGNAGKGDA